MTFFPVKINFISIRRFPFFYGIFSSLITSDVFRDVVFFEPNIIIRFSFEYTRIVKFYVLTCYELKVHYYYYYYYPESIGPAHNTRIKLETVYDYPSFVMSHEP